MSATLAAIWRHPIKGHGRERLDRVTLRAGATLPFDRRWAVLHDRAADPAGNWAACTNFTRGAGSPALMAVTAKLDEAAGTITLRHPARADITFAPDGDTAAFIDWAAPLVPPDRPKPARLVRAGTQGMTDTAFPSISIGNLATLRALCDRLGHALSPDRFRANLWIDGIPAWHEFDLVGRSLRIGDAILRIEERITRCRATEANPETGTRDADTLQGLRAGWGHTDFGVYAIVARDGRIAVGDTVAP